MNTTLARPTTDASWSRPHLEVADEALPTTDPDESMIEVVVQIEYVDERPKVEDQDWSSLRRSCQERSLGLVLLTKPELSAKEPFLEERKGSA